MCSILGVDWISLRGEVAPASMGHSRGGELDRLPVIQNLGFGDEDVGAVRRFSFVLEEGVAT
jgi:hypothetical protein